MPTLTDNRANSVIITTTNIEEKSIQQHGKGYIVPSKIIID
jgi:hypothetical protein